MNDPKILKEAAQPEPAAPKQPYEKPAIIFRAPLEATAGVCSEAPGKTAYIPPDTCTVLVS